MSGFVLKTGCDTHAHSNLLTSLIYMQIDSILHENTSGFEYVHTQYMTHMYMTQMQELDN
jgi:hypothetical protein